MYAVPLSGEGEFKLARCGGPSPRMEVMIASNISAEILMSFSQT
jgi:hypothetical protein